LRRSRADRKQRQRCDRRCRKQEITEQRRTAAVAATFVDRKHVTPRRRNEPVTAILAVSRAAFAVCGSREPTVLDIDARTPRPTRSRVTVSGGRSPGSRVAVFDHLPRNVVVPSGNAGRRLTAYSCGGSRGIVRIFTRTAFPFDPLREPPSGIVEWKREPGQAAGAKKNQSVTLLPRCATTTSAREQAGAAPGLWHWPVTLHADKQIHDAVTSAVHTHAPDQP
jgi:hypothetical protein